MASLADRSLVKLFCSFAHLVAEEMKLNRIIPKSVTQSWDLNPRTWHCDPDHNFVVLIWKTDNTLHMSLEGTVS